jgi:hypothetical protein
MEEQTRKSLQWSNQSMVGKFGGNSDQIEDGYVDDVDVKTVSCFKWK